MRTGSQRRRLIEVTGTPWDGYFYSGRQLTGVTTIINSVLRAPQLEEWMKRMGTKADAIRDEAAAYGKSIHAALAAYCRGDKLLPLEMPKAWWTTVEAGRRWIDDNIDEVYAVETPVASLTYGYAGTFAFHFAHDGDLSRFSADEIALGIDYEGDSDALLEALDGLFVTCGKIGDWESWGGALFSSRRHESARKWEQRKDGKAAEQEKMSQGQTGTMRDNGPEEKREDLKPPIVPHDKAKNRARERFESEFWPRWPNKKGTKQQTRERFEKLSVKNQEKCIVAEGFYIEALTAGLIEPQRQYRSENFVGGSKEYWKEWQDGIPDYLKPKRHDQTTADRVQACFKCGAEMSPDDMLDRGEFVEGRGWCHKTCPDGEEKR